MSFLALSSIRKSFAANTVVKDFTLGVERGEFVSLLGPSGCGKTTVLRMIAGFETPSAGSLRIDGEDVTALPPNRRRIGMVFQSYALFPNLTVAQNVAFGLRVAGVPGPERETRVAEMLRLIGLPDLGARYPYQLSGGQQQRVALARALAVRPRVLLLDEPLSALDAKIRVSLRSEIREIQRDLGITTIFVTHDQEEALSMSDRVVVMNGGVAEQVGTPFEIYNRPRTRFVAGFVGTLNQLEAVVRDPGRGLVEIGGTTLTMSGPLAVAPGRRVRVAFRPEAIRIGAAPGREVMLRARITAVDFMGAVIRIRAETEGGTLSLDTFNRPDTPPPGIGTRTDLSLSSRDLIVLEDGPAA
ncbi:ABC transporter ATP-binding protein [Oceaniglobus roseus]|uniref:ABC transporter ATP-binding protein n=1 Tax=Oceaniglobus roseus TaxID=1737570 RepID=UPI000C7EEB27|nr:ABC transporter ATP-binding protein [Kandeliimicrobium roseum]